MPWNFRELQATGAVGVVEQWLNGLQPASTAHKVRQKFRAMLMGMMPLGQDQWPDKWVTKLKGHDEVFELRFKVLNVQYRPLFFFGPGKSEITFVFPGAREASDEFVPRDAVERAHELIRELRTGEYTTHEIDLYAL